MVWNARFLADYEDGPAILKVGQDITFLKQAQERALQSERLAAIGEMVTGLAHESRNALQRSQACLEMLGPGRPRPPRGARPDQPHPEGPGPPPHALRGRPRLRGPDQARQGPVRLEQIWREAWDHLESARADKQPVLVEATDGVDLACIADPFRLEQVFRNILDNALAAGSAPVAVEVRAEEVRAPGPARDPDRRPRQRAGHPARPASPRSSTRSSPPRPRGPAWAWPSPGGSSRPTAAGSASANGDEPGATFLITLPRGCP